MLDRIAVGRLGEDLAVAHYERLGYRVLARNHRTRHGEIDLVVTDERTLVFCEVKSRGPGGRSPWDSLGAAKQARVRAMACSFLATERDRPRLAEIRFDAVGVTLDARGHLVRLDHLEGAF